MKCVVCGKEFVKHRYNEVSCSVECKKEHVRMRKKKWGAANKERIRIKKKNMFDLYNQISNLFVEVACLKKENRRLKKQILRGWKKEYK